METCYFSHCWDDSYKLKQYIKQQIEKRSENRVKVIFDRDSFKVGDHLKAAENNILSSDTVVIFFSPGYKCIINEPDVSRGVFREYELLKMRMQNDKENIIPILYIGDKKSSIPSDFLFEKYEDITNIRPFFVKKENRLTVSKKNKKKIEELADIIIKKTNEKNKIRPYEFNNDKEKYELLFHVTESTGKLPRECMVRFEAHEDILSQTCYFVVGRKGSGKSTLLEILENFEPEKFQQTHKDLNPMNAEDIDLELLYSTITNYKKDYTIFSMPRLLDLFWELYIAFYCIYVVGIEEEMGRVLDERRDIFHTVTNILKTNLNVKKLQYDDTKKSIYTLSVEKLDEFIGGNILLYATEESFIASIKANATPYNILSDFFSESIFDEFLVALNKCRKRIFIGLDGFDTLSDDFGRKTNNYIDSADMKDYGLDRLDFEKTFYRSLVYVVKQFTNKKRKSMLSTIEGIIDFCIILPKDRLDKIETIDRDISKVKFCRLNWDAIDLLQMVVLRLEYIAKINRSSGDTNWVSRFEYAMDILLPKLPKKVSILMDNQAEKSIDIFSYTLRLSSWNPRYILKQFALLYSASEKAKETNSEIDKDTIKHLLTNESRNIIKREFIKEYETILNIEDILNSFMNFDFVNNSEEFCDKLMKVNFKTVIPGDYSQIKDRLFLLYELGIIGLLLSKKIYIRQGFGNEYCYVYNEGLEPIEINLHDMSTFYKEIKIVFNPMFCKYMSLFINTNDVIGNFGWEYLKINHQKKIERRF